MHGHTNVKYVLYRLFEYRYVSVLHMNNSKLSDTCLHIFLGMYRRLNRCVVKKNRFSFPDCSFVRNYEMHVIVA
jgi:hypothetical protein